MKKKYLFLSVVLVFVFITSAYASSLQDLIDGAMANSPRVEEIKISRQNSDISTKLSELEDQTVLKVDGSLTQNNLNDKANTVAKMDFSAQIPKDDDLTVSAGVNVTGKLVWFDDSSTFSMTPSAGLTKTIDVSSYTDTREDISKQKNNIQIVLNYEKSLIQFENQLINDVISILQLKRNIYINENNLQDSIKNLEIDLALGTVTKDSIVELERNMSISKSKISLDSMKDQLTNALEAFENSYAVEYQDVTDEEEWDLQFNDSSKENSSVLLKRMDLETAKQNLEAKIGTTETYKITANANAPVSYNRGTSLGLNANVSGEAKLDNITVSASFSTGFSNIGKSNFDWTPSLSVSGSWSNASKTKEQTTELEVQKLQNAILTAQSSLDSAIYDYNNEVKSLVSEIESHKIDLQQLEVQTSYHNQVLSYTQELFDKGLTTEKALKSAKDDCLDDEYQKLVLALKSRILANKIKIIEL